MAFDTSVADYMLGNPALVNKALKMPKGNHITTDSHTRTQHAQARQAAEQFEAMLLQTMLKAMRQSTPGNAMFNDQHASMYREMFDQHVSKDVSTTGAFGIADAIYKQISAALPAINNTTESSAAQNKLRQLPIPITHSATLRYDTPALSSSTTYTAKTSALENHGHNPIADFIQRITPAATNTAQKLGTSSDLIIAIAALESGWGLRTPQHSNNLFGIKASHAWRGNVVSSPTIEHRNGSQQQETADFRKYHSIEESIRDFGDFLQQNPRYEKALQHADDAEQFIREIHRAGYATDPQYSTKVIAVLQTVKANHSSDSAL